MSAKGYNERTFISLLTDVCFEVYGDNGYRWYTATKDAKEVAALFRGVTLELSANTTWTYLVGLTSAKLRKAGFME